MLEKRIVKRFGENISRVSAIALSRDGMQVLTGANDGTARLWDARSGNILTLFSRNAKPASSIASTPSGQFFAVVSNGGHGRLWNLEKGAVVGTFKAIGRGYRPDAINPGKHAVAFSHDGSLLITGHTDGAARFMEYQNGAAVTEIRGTFRCNWRGRNIA